MPVKTVLDGSAVPVRIWTDDIDEGSKAQLANIASLPFIHHHVAAMPDVHLGIGATIGSVIATHQAIIPAAVGVDIGCGMVAARLSLTANDIDEKRLKKVFDQISRDVPVGRDQHADGRVLVDAVRPFEPGLKALTERHPQLLKAFGKFSKWVNQMGTLGGVSLIEKNPVENCQSTLYERSDMHKSADALESIGFDLNSIYNMTSPPGRCGQPERLSISVGRKAVGNSRTPKGLSTGSR